MKKSFYILLLFSALLFSCEQKDAYVITSKLQNFSDSLVFVTNICEKKTDTIVCKNNRFEIKGVADSITYLSVYAPGIGAWLDIWVCNKDHLVISGDAKYPDLIKINGNTIHNKLSSFKEANTSLFREKSDLHYMQQEALTDSLLVGNSNEPGIAAKISNINHQLKEKADIFVRNNPGEPAALVLLRDHLVDVENVDKLDEYLSLLQPPVTGNDIYRQLTALSRKVKQTNVGALAPEFEIIDVKNDTARLSDYKDKYLLLTFAASWCNVCRKDNRELVKAYEKYRKKGLKMLTVSFDENKEDWQSAVKEDKINWRQAIDTSGWGAQMLELYNISTIPSNFLIDKSGMIVCKNLYGEELMKKLNDILM
ncbi:MAG: TlpA family protein disulfide reductase [Dysgonamonadaceae bacterium]|jgi:peroxiredoxin|nr:TlpA family protein disulfide reductase [Dysgonamonadaceae bacterium]